MDYPRSRRAVQAAPVSTIARQDGSQRGHADLTEAVIFDLDGVLIDSEPAWGEVRRQFVLERGGRWHDHAQRDMMGMSSAEWSRYIHEELGVDMPPERNLGGGCRTPRSPVPRAAAAPAGRAWGRGGLAERWPLALATSSNRELIGLVLEARPRRLFQATVSSEEVAHGKPAPDVYLAAARSLGAEPSRCAAIEDSHNGILSAAAAGMRVIAIPNRDFPPRQEALAKAARVLGRSRSSPPR